jgi:hypothetical protein
LDTTGQAGTDTLTFALEDDNGEGPEEETFRVSIEPAPEAGATESDTSKSDVTKTASSMKDNCRIQFAATTPKDSSSLSKGNIAEKLQSEKVDFSVRSYAKNGGGVLYGLFSERSGTRGEMEELMTKGDMQSVVESIDENVFVHCF